MVVVLMFWVESTFKWWSFVSVFSVFPSRSLYPITFWVSIFIACIGCVSYGVLPWILLRSVTADIGDYGPPPPDWSVIMKVYSWHGLTDLLVCEPLFENHSVWASQSFFVFMWGARGNVVVEALSYKPEGHGIASRWSGFFSDLPNPSDHTMVLGSTEPLTEISTRNLKKETWG
jgi:hypothetical protein